MSVHHILLYYLCTAYKQTHNKKAFVNVHQSAGFLSKNHLVNNTLL